MTDELGYCSPKVTGVIEASLDTVWAIMRQWSTFYWLELVSGQVCTMQLYEGNENAIGSVRSVEIGESLMFERLVAMDDETHTMKWRTIAHPDSVTPFTKASYINSLLYCNLREITHNDHTFMEWGANFYTEPEFSSEMHTVLEEWIKGAIKALQKHVLTEEPTVNHRVLPPPHVSHTQPQISHQVQMPLPEDHVARFADLHIGGSVGGSVGGSRHQMYGGIHEQANKGPPMRGVPAPRMPDPYAAPSGRPMGSSRQAPRMSATQPVQSWQQPQAPPMHHPRSPRRRMSTESARAVQDWAAQQQSHHHRPSHRSQMPSNYAGSIYSDLSESAENLSQYRRQRNRIEPVYAQPAPQYLYEAPGPWDGVPLGPQGNIYHDQFDQRSVQSSRSRRAPSSHQNLPTRPSK